MLTDFKLLATKKKRDFIVKYAVNTENPLNVKTKCLVVVIEQAQKLNSLLTEIDNATEQSISQLQKQGSLNGETGKTVLLHSPKGLEAETLLLATVNTSSDFTNDECRNLCNRIATELKRQQIQEAAFCMPFIEDSNIAIDTCSRHLLEAIGDKFYKYIHQPVSLKHKNSKEKDFKATLITANKEDSQSAKDGAGIGLAISNGKTMARNLGNMPGNVCTPTYLAERAEELGKSNNLNITILEEDEMSKLGMGSLLSVSRGSRQPAKLIVMEYKGAKDKKQAPHALVGKGLTFDAGGISIKPSGKMDEMKYDMCGAASVFGTMLSVSELKLPINVVAVVPSSENLPDGDANKPGDVVTSMSGRTIEILNTDAEGRLILCDALTYTEKFEPATVIDVATLTGACIVALGHHTNGLMGNDQELVNEIIDAGETSLDRAWQLPLFEPYHKQLKSNFADLANIGGPAAGTITAGCFLSKFTNNFRWAHLDIAGTAWTSGANKGATGRVVPILTQYLIDQSIK